MAAKLVQTLQMLLLSALEFVRPLVTPLFEKHLIIPDQFHQL
jgi:hypothetical protein